MPRLSLWVWFQSIQRMIYKIIILSFFFSGEHYLYLLFCFISCPSTCLVRLRIDPVPISWGIGLSNVMVLLYAKFKRNCTVKFIHIHEILILHTHDFTSWLVIINVNWDNFENSQYSRRIYYRHCLSWFFLLVIVLFVISPVTASDFTFGIFKIIFLALTIY